MAQFKVIRNPKNLVFKHEVWYSGKVEAPDARGYMTEVDVCKPVDSFITEEKANEFIQYQQNVRSFQGTAK